MPDKNQGIGIIKFIQTRKIKSNHMLKCLIHCLLYVLTIIKLRVEVIMSFLGKRQRIISKQPEPLRWKQICFHNRLNCPSARWGQAMTSIRNDILLFGGYTGTTFLKDLWFFDNQHLIWTKMKPQQNNQIEPEARSCSSLHFHQLSNKIILFGGGTPQFLYNDVYFMNWNGEKKWEKINFDVNCPSPQPRTYHSSNLIGKYLIVFGGYCGIDLNDLWIFDMQIYQWRQIKAKVGYAPKARRFHSATILKEKLFIFGGLQKENQLLCIEYVDLKPFLQMDIYQLHWIQISKTYPNLERWGHSSLVVNQRIMIFGGQTKYCHTEIVQFKQKSRSLKDIKIQDNEPKESNMRRRSFTLIGNSVVAFGGFDFGTYSNSFKYLNLQNLQKQKDEDEENPCIVNSLFSPKLQSDFQSDILVNKLNQYLQQLYFNHHKQKGELLSVNNQTYTKLQNHLQLYTKQAARISINNIQYKIKAKRACIVSDYFKNCFNYGEDTFNLTFEYISTVSVMVCVNFINTECPIICEDFQLRILLEIAQLSAYFSLIGLTDKIQQLLSKNINISNCDKLLCLSSRLNLKKLFRKCIQFLFKVYIKNENIVQTFRMPLYQLSKVKEIRKNMQIQLRQIRMKVLRQ